MLEGLKGLIGVRTEGRGKFVFGVARVSPSFWSVDKSLRVRDRNIVLIHARRRERGSMLLEQGTAGEEREPRNDRFFRHGCPIKTPLRLEAQNFPASRRVSSVF